MARTRSRAETVQPADAAWWMQTSKLLRKFVELSTENPDRRDLLLQKINQMPSECGTDCFRLHVHAVGGNDRLIFLSYPRGFYVTLIGEGVKSIFEQSHITGVVAQQVLNSMRRIRAGIDIDIKLTEVK